MWSVGSGGDELVKFHTGSAEDPLDRMSEAAWAHGLDVVVRITHDKIFVDPGAILHFLKIFQESELDYLYSSSFVPGTGFEIIRARTLYEARNRFKNVEHVSYAIQAVTDKKTDVPMGHKASPHRLLIDYPEDVQVVDEILVSQGVDCSLDKALAFLDRYPSLSNVNRLPKVTVYTCAFNAEEWIAEAIRSVLSQLAAGLPYEYILVDDASTDKTAEVMKRFAERDERISVHSLAKNVGLASASNFALSRARGEFIVRLDADDYFVDEFVLYNLVACIESSGVDAVYPDHYYGNARTIEKGATHHHVGGAMFRTRAVNHIKFTEGLRGYEGYDFFKRAKDQLRIWYFDQATFFYRQHADSLTKGDPEERAKIKREIDDRNS